jgi:hypothetical protein
VEWRLASPADLYAEEVLVSGRVWLFADHLGQRAGEFRLLGVSPPGGRVAAAEGREHSEAQGGGDDGTLLRCDMDQEQRDKLKMDQIADAVPTKCAICGYVITHPNNMVQGRFTGGGLGPCHQECWDDALRDFGQVDPDEVCE